MYKLRRIKQVILYGWKHADRISKLHFDGKYHLSIFFDILLCYYKYSMWSSEYLRESVWTKNRQEREALGNQLRIEHAQRDEWLKNFYDNRHFLAHWRKFSIESNPRKRAKRNEAYIKYYKMGEGCAIEYEVEFSRQHFLEGSLHIGKNILFAKNVFIDYSGHVTIKDNVQLTNGVIIETHHHPFHSDYTKSRSEVIATDLVIEEGAVIGSRAIILSSCHYIGKHARVGAGAVVTKDVADYEIVAGVPAHSIRSSTP